MLGFPKKIFAPSDTAVMSKPKGTPSAPAGQSARPSGGGWENVPGGSHGGLRRKEGGKWSYWYPTEPAVHAARDHHWKAARAIDDVSPKNSAGFISDPDKRRDYLAHEDVRKQATDYLDQKPSRIQVGGNPPILTTPPPVHAPQVKHVTAGPPLEPWDEPTTGSGTPRPGVKLPTYKDAAAFTRAHVGMTATWHHRTSEWHDKQRDKAAKEIQQIRHDVGDKPTPRDRERLAALGNRREYHTRMHNAHALTAQAKEAGHDHSVRAGQLAAEATQFAHQAHSPTLAKAAPFIGPKGGKYSDPKHEHSWKPARLMTYDIVESKRHLDPETNISTELHRTKEGGGVIRVLDHDVNEAVTIQHHKSYAAAEKTYNEKWLPAAMKKARVTKYTRRTGSPGKYKYEYADEKKKPKTKAEPKGTLTEQAEKLLQHPDLKSAAGNSDVLRARIAGLGYSDPCPRCGGSGRYSFNQMHGDMCYGCQGAGKVPAKLTPDLLANLKKDVEGGALDRYVTELKRKKEVAASARSAEKEVSDAVDAMDWYKHHYPPDKKNDDLSRYSHLSYGIHGVASRAREIAHDLKFAAEFLRGEEREKALQDLHDRKPKLLALVRTADAVFNEHLKSGAIDADAKATHDAHEAYRGGKVSYTADQNYRFERTEAGAKLVEAALKKQGIDMTALLAPPAPRKNLKKAGGPYYGPRGGKWADAKHTISWSDKPKPSGEHSGHWEPDPTKNHTDLKAGDTAEIGGLRGHWTYEPNHAAHTSGLGWFQSKSTGEHKLVRMNTATPLRPRVERKPTPHVGLKPVVLPPRTQPKKIKIINRVKASPEGDLTYDKPAPPEGSIRPGSKIPMVIPFENSNAHEGTLMHKIEHGGVPLAHYKDEKYKGWRWGIHLDDQQKNQLAVELAPLINKVVHTTAKRYNLNLRQRKEAADDVRGAAYQGMVMAISRYKGGASFGWLVKQLSTLYAGREAANLMHAGTVPDHKLALVRGYIAARHQARALAKDEPTLEQIARQWNVSKRHVFEGEKARLGKYRKIEGVTSKIIDQSNETLPMDDWMLLGPDGKPVDERKYMGKRSLMVVMDALASGQAVKNSEWMEQHPTLPAGGQEPLAVRALLLRDAHKVLEAMPKKEAKALQMLFGFPPYNEPMRREQISDALKLAPPPKKGRKDVSEITKRRAANEFIDNAAKQFKLIAEHQHNKPYMAHQMNRWMARTPDSPLEGFDVGPSLRELTERFGTAERADIYLTAIRAGHAKRTAKILEREKEGSASPAEQRRVRKDYHEQRTKDRIAQFKMQTAHRSIDPSEARDTGAEAGSAAESPWLYIDDGVIADYYTALLKRGKE